MEYAKKRDVAWEKKITLYAYNELQTRTVDFFLEKEADLKSCLTNENQEYYACIVVGINSKSKIDFLDVADEVNKLDNETKNCLEKKMRSYNYKDIQASLGTKFTMPLKLSTKK